MKFQIQRANERGHANHGWLDTYHSFSFASYYNPKKMGFGALIVLNDDTITGGTGFGTHPHENMEIITIPLDGAIAHKDSMGVIEEVDNTGVQVMSAGTGLTHSEFNASKTNKGHFLQLWILPHTQDVVPRHDSRTFDPTARQDAFQLLVSSDGRDGSLMIHQDAFISRITLSPGTKKDYSLFEQGNGLYVFIISGEVACDTEVLHPKDAMEIHPGLSSLSLEAKENSHVLVIEVPVME